MSQQGIFSRFSFSRDGLEMVLVGLFLAAGLYIIFSGIGSAQESAKENQPGTTRSLSSTSSPEEPPKAESSEISYPPSEAETFLHPADISVLDTGPSQPSPPVSAPVPSPKPTPPSAETTWYYLVTGSFDNLEAATRSASGLAQKGYDARLKYPPPGQSKPFRVFVLRSDKKEVAEAFQKKLREASGVSSWVIAEP